MKMVIQMEWDCPFNWKVLAENFMESYHHIGAHAKTLQPMMPAKNTWNEEERPAYIRAHLPLKDALFEEIQSALAQGEHPYGFPKIETLSEEQCKEWHLFLVHPLMLMSANPDRLIFYRMMPLGPDLHEAADHHARARQRHGASRLASDARKRNANVCATSTSKTWRSAPPCSAAFMRAGINAVASATWRCPCG